MTKTRAGQGAVAKRSRRLGRGGAGGDSGTGTNRVDIGLSNERASAECGAIHPPRRSNRQLENRLHRPPVGRIGQPSSDAEVEDPGFVVDIRCQVQAVVLLAPRQGAGQGARRKVQLRPDRNAFADTAGQLQAPRQIRRYVPAAIGQALAQRRVDHRQPVCRSPAWARGAKPAAIASTNSGIRRGMASRGGAQVAAVHGQRQGSGLPFAGERGDLTQYR